MSVVCSDYAPCQCRPWRHGPNLGCLEANKYSYTSFGCLLIGRASCSDVDARTSSGRLFQTAGAAAAKARSPIVEHVRHVLCVFQGQIAYAMLYTLRLLIGAQKVLKGPSAENHQLMIGFCLQALEMSRHRLYVRTSITHHEQDWLLTLENYITEFILKCDVDKAQDVVIMYIDAIKTAGVKFYGGAYPLVLMDKLYLLRIQYGSRELVEICAEMLLGLMPCLEKLTFTVDLVKGLLLSYTTRPTFSKLPKIFFRFPWKNSCPNSRWSS